MKLIKSNKMGKLFFAFSMEFSLLKSHKMFNEALKYVCKGLNKDWMENLGRNWEKNRRRRGKVGPFYSFNTFLERFCFIVLLGKVFSLSIMQSFYEKLFSTEFCWVRKH